MAEGAKSGKETVFPLSRVKTIMRSSAEVKELTPDSVFLVAKAAEAFVSHLAREALEATENKNSLEYSDLAKLISERECYAFLMDIIPKKITGAEYFKLMEQVEKEEAELRKEDEI